MNTKIQRGIVAVVLFLPILLAIFLLVSSVFRSQSVLAYPPPPTTTPIPPGYPPPATPTPPGTLPEFQPITYLFVPGIKNDFKMRFSISGQNNINKIREVIPTGLEAEGYNWAYTNPGKIQMIRPCITFRNKDADETGVNFLAGYTNINKYCWDSGDEYTHAGTKRIVQIVYSPGSCPYGWDTCLDVQINPNSYAAETAFAAQYISVHPDYTWLVGNEPDSTWQDALNTSFGNYHADYTTYAEFFAYLYDLVLDNIPEENFSPRLVFCQATYAGYDVDGWGLHYCEDAFDELNRILEENYGYAENYAANTIFALSAHQYLVFCYELDPYNEKCDGELLDEGVLNAAVEQAWIPRLQEFEQWALNVGMGDKPLWLTEFGSFRAWCHEEQTLLGPDPGIPCKASNHPDSDADNNCEDDGIDEIEWGRDVYFGRNKNEGIWGLQRALVGYLSQDNNWRRAWWFNATMGDYDPCESVEGGPSSPAPSSEHNLCVFTTWIWGDSSGLCFPNRNTLGRPGITLRTSLTSCVIGGEDCAP